jgi:hypothetical protein
MAHVIFSYISILTPSSTMVIVCTTYFNIIELCTVAIGAIYVFHIVLNLTENYGAGEDQQQFTRQTRPLVREGVPHQQTRNCLTVIKIWYWAPDGC